MGCMCAKPAPSGNAAGIHNDVYEEPKGPLVLYHMDASPPSRSALVTARQLGLDLDIRRVNILAGEHLNPDYVKINPEHTVPTLNDNDFILWESRAICTYLANKYGRDPDFYPKDEKRRALVDRRLYFDATTLYAAVSNLIKPIFQRLETQPSEPKKRQLLAALQLLDMFLTDSLWVAGDKLTVADTVIVASVASAQALGVDMTAYPNINAWLGRCRRHMKAFEENEAGARVYGQAVQSVLGAPAFP